MTAAEMHSNGIADPAPPAGVVELREDVPLKGGSGGGSGGVWCAGGPRLIITCFAALTAAITLALFTQIYYGDFEVVPHGSVSSGAAACSRAGTDALKAGGRAMDAAVAAALCLAVAAPHRTSLDASGAMVYWEYRKSRTEAPTVAEWGPGGATQPAGGTTQPAGGGERPPRLVAALALLHAQLGVLPWSRLLQPAINLARGGFPVSEGLAAVLASDAAAVLASDAAADGGGGMSLPVEVGSLTTAPALAGYLQTLQNSSSAELSVAWNASGLVRMSSSTPTAAGSWRVHAAGGGAPLAARALAPALDPPPKDIDEASIRVLEALQTDLNNATEPAAPGPGGVATGLAVVDQLDTYLALVTGTSVAFGSGGVEGAGWRRDEPPAALGLAPAVLVQAAATCGARYVLAAEAGAALAQAAAVAAAGGGAAAVERPRLVERGGRLLAEAGRAVPLGAPVGLPPAPAPHAAVNVVQQTADALLSHADSRGGGLASRF